MTDRGGVDCNMETWTERCTCWYLTESVKYQVIEWKIATGQNRFSIPIATLQSDQWWRNTMSWYCKSLQTLTQQRPNNLPRTGYRSSNKVFCEAHGLTPRQARWQENTENTSIAASATEKLFVSRYIKCYSFFVSGSKDRRGRRSKNARKNMSVRNEGKEKQKKKNLPQKCRTLTLLRQLVITWHQSALQDNQHPFIITVKGIKNVHTHWHWFLYT